MCQSLIADDGPQHDKCGLCRHEGDGVPVLVHRPGKWRPELRAIEGELLRELQQIVGGYIEAVPYSRRHGRIAFCNDNGHRLGLLPNEIAVPVFGQSIVGPIVELREVDA